ncbi:MAG: hypothetical protein EOO45_07730 [Flavobacterium sp.]|nr:MAG: hypothetical protein EOO45_07730 [Flavobacterium sp.]
MSIPFRFLAVSVVLLWSVCSTMAQSIGCYVTLGVSTPQMFYEREPGSTGTPARFYNYSSYQVNCPAGASSSVSHAAFLGYTTSPATVCWAQRRPGASTAPNPNPNNAGEYILNGFLSRYGIQQCPIDDYIPFILAGLAGTGYLFLKRNPTYNKQQSTCT